MVFIFSMFVVAQLFATRVSMCAADTTPRRAPNAAFLSTDETDPINDHPISADSDGPFGIQFYGPPLPKKTILISVVIQVILTIVIAAVYQNQRVEPQVEQGKSATSPEEFKTWKFGLFGCLEDVPICLCGCFCPAIRWGTTLGTAKMAGFWSAFIIFLLFETWNELAFMYIGSSGILGLGFVIYLAYIRQQMRAKFAMPHGDCSSWVGDILTYCCCSCCAVVQEARHIEEAIRCGQK